MASCTVAINSPADWPNAENPRMASSSAPIRALMKPVVSPVVRFRNTACMGQPQETVRSAVAFCGGLIQTDASEFRIKKKTRWDKTAGGDAQASEEIVANDTEIVESDCGVVLIEFHNLPLQIQLVAFSCNSSDLI